MKSGLAEDLARWYRAVRRPLPWRQTRDSYRIWLSEIMLQQTQVTTVEPYYERFLARFPTIEALAAADDGEVMKLWEGLGYYARCRNLLKAARHVVDYHGGRFPTDIEAVRSLPGIGRSTAGAILTFAAGQRHPILDGNVKRVLSRLFDFDGDTTRAAGKRRLWELSTDLLAQAKRADDFNQALMELGAVVCTPRSPRCPDCPVRTYCDANARGTVAQRPVKPRRKPTPHHHIAVGVVWRDDRHVLIQLRPAEGLLGGLWEFPGGKREPNEPLERTVAREIAEELGIDVEVGDEFCTVKHAYSHFRITLHAFHCRYRGGTPQPRASQAIRWEPLERLDAYAFPKANRAVLDELTAGRS